MQWILLEWEFAKTLKYASYFDVSANSRVPPAKSVIPALYVCAQFSYLSFDTGFIKKSWETPEE